MYGFDGNMTALEWLLEFGGKNLTEADKAEMFRQGYMDDDLKPTAVGRKAYAARQTGDDMYVGGRVTAGPDHLVSCQREASDGFDDPHLSEVVNLGHGAGVPQPRFPAEKPVSYRSNDGDYPEQMQGSTFDWGMDTIATRKGKPPQAS